MEADDFIEFLAHMRWSDAEAMRKLGIGSHNTLAAYKQSGGPPWLGLACAAIAAGLPPWKSNLVLVHAFRVWNQGAGEHLLARGLRTEESIQQIGGEVVPGSAVYADPADIYEGRLEMTDADDFYVNRLLKVATADEIPPDQIQGFISDCVYLHTSEGRGDRSKLLRLFNARAPKTETAKRIRAAIEHFL